MITVKNPEGSVVSTTSYTYEYENDLPVKMIYNESITLEYIQKEIVIGE